jgi:hypothetical protein
MCAAFAQDRGGMCVESHKRPNRGVVGNTGGASIKTARSAPKRKRPR